MKTTALVLSAGFAASLSLSASAAFEGAVTAGNTSVWRIDSNTGSVSLCSESGQNRAADCYPASKAEKKGDYRILVGNDIMSTWRINTVSGAVSKCEYNDTEEPPKCSPWSK